MQDCAALRNELQDLRTSFPCLGVSVVRSHERWNPVAAIVISSAKLPSVIMPDTIDVRIPIPNLYGFAVSANIAVIGQSLQERVTGNSKLRSVPFCVKIIDATLDIQRDYYVDVRENREKLLGRYSVCVTPRILPPRYVHIPLIDFMSSLLTYLSDPTATVVAELDECKDILAKYGVDPHLLLRMSHLYEGLTDYSAALAIAEQACTLYPNAEWFRRKAAQLHLAADGGL